MIDADRNGRTGDLIAAGTYEGVAVSPGDRIYRVEFDGGRGGARGPNYFQVDLRSGWRFRLQGRQWLDVSVDVFNVFNRTQFDTPSGNQGSTAFLILDDLQARNIPRAAQVQFTLHY